MGNCLRSQFIKIAQLHEETTADYAKNGELIQTNVQHLEAEIVRHVGKMKTVAERVRGRKNAPEMATLKNMAVKLSTMQRNLAGVSAQAAANEEKAFNIKRFSMAMAQAAIDANMTKRMRSAGISTTEIDKHLDKVSDAQESMTEATSAIEDSNITVDGGEYSVDDIMQQALSGSLWDGAGDSVVASYADQGPGANPGSFDFVADAGAVEMKHKHDESVMDRLMRIGPNGSKSKAEEDSAGVGFVMSKSHVRESHQNVLLDEMGS